MDHPSLIEITWTVLSIIFLTVSMWQLGLSVGDWRAKRYQAHFSNGDAKAGETLARWLMYTAILDSVILACWTIAGSLSVFRHYFYSISELPELTLVLLLYLAMFSFGIRVALRTYIRVRITKF